MFWGEVIDVIEDDEFMFGEGGFEHIPETVLIFDHQAHSTCNRFQLFARRKPCCIGTAYLLGDEELESTDANHAEFVQIGGGYGEELQAFEQGDGRIGRLVKDALVEFEPAQFTVEERGERFFSGFLRVFLRDFHGLIRVVEVASTAKHDHKKISLFSQ